MVSSLPYIDKNSDRIKFHYLKDILRMESMMVNEILATVIKKVLNPIQLVLFRQMIEPCQKIPNDIIKFNLMSDKFSRKYFRLSVISTNNNRWYDSCLLPIPLNILYCPLHSFLSLQALIKLISVIAFYEDHN
ncbi:hypothetical protein H8356DRAFT_1343798 [Neocallimastix lanati (nom. inval.)]|nr:hypothetical protein H8356DRAFT_1343798 [Neocallimastix sp. JGI-2020a]